jgi:hypothetical protein
LRVVVHVLRVVGPLSLRVLIHHNLSIEVGLTESLLNNLLISFLVEGSMSLPNSFADGERLLNGVRVASINNLFQVLLSLNYQSSLEFLLTLFVHALTEDLRSRRLVFALEFNEHLFAISFVGHSKSSLFLISLLGQLFIHFVYIILFRSTEDRIQF